MKGTLVLWGVAIALICPGCALNSSTNSTAGHVNSVGVSPAPTATTTQAAAAAPQTFTGSGIEKLGTINVPTDSVLTWKCSCATVIEFLSDPTPNGNQIVITTTAASGHSEVTADTYRNVVVGASGSFTITITPNG
jgi:hypothetical protein